MERNELLQRLSAIPTGNVADAMAKLEIPCQTITGLHPLVFSQRRVAGCAVTIKQMVRSANKSEANLTKHPKVMDEMVTNGDLIIIDVGGALTPCTGGALLTRRAKIRGAVGLIVNGCLRDLAEIAEQDFPVHLKGGSPLRSYPSLETVGINIPIEIGDTQVCPGDIVLMDETGIVVIPPEEAERICFCAEEIMKREAIVEELVNQGMSVLKAVSHHLK